MRIVYTSRLLGAIGSSEPSYIDTCDEEIVQAGGIINLLYKKFPDRENFFVISSDGVEWRNTGDKFAHLI